MASVERKLGRNALCQCGSGKKYKHCCQKQQNKKIPAIAVDTQQLILSAMQFQQTGFLPEAEKLCHQVLEVSPANPDAKFLLGAIAIQNGDFDQAIAETKESIKLNSHNPDACCNLGLALHEQGQLDVALEWYKKALEIKPGNINALYNMHALLIQIQGLEAAIRCLQKLLEINPNDWDAKFTAGALIDYSGNSQTAEIYFKTLATSPKRYQARLDAWKYLKSTFVNTPTITGSNKKTFEECLSVATVDGMILEFGVRHANTIRQIAGLVDQQVHGFDSFEGLPEVWHHEPKGSYTTKGVIPQVPANVKLHVGWFEDTLPKFLETHSGPVRFVNVDCDIYSSTKTVLDALAPRIVPGTVLAFDEYIGNEHWREDEFKAFQESVKKYGWKYEYICFSLFTKQVAVIIKSTATI